MGGELRVAFHKGEGQIRLRVKDTGIGLPKGFSEQPLATLGLQLVRMLTKQLGGTVTFDSAGSGTSVEVRVPLREHAG
jgi:two-component sensor histidine kinase